MTITARLGRFCGAGLMLLALQVVAMLTVGWAVSCFHQRLNLLLEPLTVACGGVDPVARMQVAEHLIARAGALDGWTPLHWLPIGALLPALLGTMLVNVHWLHQVDVRFRRSAWGLLALHGIAFTLAAFTVVQYERLWNGIVRRMPPACMSHLEMDTGDGPLPPLQWSMHLFAHAGLPLPHAPDALAIILAGVLLACMVIGLWLWRVTHLLDGQD